MKLLFWKKYSKATLQISQIKPIFLKAIEEALIETLSSFVFLLQT
jgi:hypothetical protein